MKPVQSKPVEDNLLERDRKAEHIKLALDERMQLTRYFFEDYSFEHVALPEIDLAEVDTSVEFLGKKLNAPLLVSSMTGGTELAGRINRNLAAAAETTGIALGVGSQRKALEDSGQAATFQVRNAAPTIPLLANLGAIQLNYGFDVAECREAVRMIDADALVLHINALQEAIQPEGQCNFAELLSKMGQIARQLGVPVIAKEVGCGISGEVARALAEQEIRIIDTAGLGGTSWARIEAQRAGDLEIGELFANWGVPTPESIQQVGRIPGVTVIGSGGIRNGIDIAKAIALGADLAGMAYPFLEAALESPEMVVAKIQRTVRELEISMFCLGARSIRDLRKVRIHRRSER
jgi:isopentenyl-diphosphate delta-isomerase